MRNEFKDQQDQKQINCNLSRNNSEFKTDDKYFLNDSSIS